MSIEHIESTIEKETTHDLGDAFWYIRTMRIILFYSDHCVSMEFNWKLNQFHSSSSHIDCDVCEC